VKPGSSATGGPAGIRAREKSQPRCETSGGNNDTLAYPARDAGGLTLSGLRWQTRSLSALRCNRPAIRPTPAATTWTPISSPSTPLTRKAGGRSETAYKLALKLYDNQSDVNLSVSSMCS